MSKSYRTTGSYEFGFLPKGLEFKTDESEWRFIPTWKGRCLFIEVTSDDNELKTIYDKAISQHNYNVESNEYPDSGFDLYIPNDFNSLSNTEKIDFGIKTAMFESVEACIVDYNYEKKKNGNLVTFNKSNPMPFYLYPRSSISKTSVRLANNVGIIDSGYRGNIGAYFDVRLNENEKKTVLTKYQRVVQICGNDLTPFKVIRIKDINSLGSTDRGQGGFGSTGLYVNLLN